jgi:WD40 repeat protein
MLYRKKFVSIFIVSLVVITGTLYFKPHEICKVIELGRIHQSVINGFRFSPDGKIIATSNDREVTLWNLKAEQIRTLSSDTTRAKIKSFAFSPDGQLIVTASNTGVTLWNTQGEQLWTSPFTITQYYDIPNLPVVDFHPDGKMIVALGNNELKLWNLKGEEIQTLHHEETIQAFKFSLDGQTIATLSPQEVKLWSRYGEELQILKRSDLTTPLRVSTKGYGFFDYVGFSPDGRTIITINSGNVNLWSQDGKLLRNLSTLMAGDVVPNPNNTAILTLHPQGARLWDYQGKLLGFFGPHELSYTRKSISWSPDNQIVATAGSSGVRLWNAENGKRIQTLPRISFWNILENIDHHFCEAVSFSSNGQIIAAICRFPGPGVFGPGVFKDGLRLWSRDGQELWTPDENGYDSYVFSPDSQMLAVKHEEQLILLKLSVSKR